MSYFNHAFCKVFWGASPDPTAPSATGYTNVAGDLSVDLYSTYGVGAFTFVDQSANNWPSVVATSAPVLAGQPLTLVATSLYQNDKIGPFDGGYQETTKSKMINPKYISRFYRVDSVAPQSNIIGIGATPNLNLTTQACCPTFYCDTTYQLQLNIKGSPVLRSLNHNAYEVAAAYTGCCGAIPTDPVDPADVMFGWMDYINQDPILSGVYNPAQRLVNVGVVVTCDNGTTWDLYLPDNPQTGVAGTYFEADGTTLTAAGTAFQTSVEAATGIVFNSSSPASTYVSIFTPATPNCCAGLVMEAAFAETKFGDCTFMPTDNFEIEPLIMQASMLDETGDPCVFDQLCISDGITPSGQSNAATIYPAIQAATQAMGTGEQVLRDLILSERYQQNDFHTGDLRIREITQGNDILSAVGRNALYTTYYILHSIPRLYNPSGTFDNDQYLLKIVTDDGPTSLNSAAFEAFMTAWLGGANSTVTLEIF